MDVSQIRQFISDFSFDRCQNGGQGYKRILIQVFGIMGDGKSEFINTCLCVWKDVEYNNWAHAAGDHAGVTSHRTPYPMTDNIILVDNRCGPMNSPQMEELYAQLANLLPLGLPVTFDTGFQLIEKIFKYEDETKPSDLIVPVFVYSGKRKISDGMFDELRSVLYTAREPTGIHPIVVVTHKSFGNLTSVETSFKNMGVERIFAFENYTERDHLKTRGRDEDVLKFLYEVIKDAQFRVEWIKDPIKEMKGCKQLFINFIYQQEKKREEENLKKIKHFNEVLRNTALAKKEEELERERQKRQQAEEELTRMREEFERLKMADQAGRKKKS